MKTKLILLLLSISLIAQDPWIEIESNISNDRNTLKSDLFIPIWGQDNHQISLDVRVVQSNFDSLDSVEGNFGLSYRQLTDEYIWGLYAFFDRNKTVFDNTFYQTTIGTELITNRYEFRINGYIPKNSKEEVVAVSPIDPDTVEIIHDETAFSLSADTSTLYEKALWGVDAEIGTIIHPEDLGFAESNWDMRLIAGWYHFDASNVEEISGPKGRVEFRSHNPFNLQGWQFVLGAETRNDDVRGSESSFLAQVRIPLGKLFNRKPVKRGTLKSRMGMGIRRDVDIVTEGYAITEKHSGHLLNPLTGEQVTKAVYFDAESEEGDGSTGSFEDPAHFADAIELAGKNNVLIGIKDSILYGSGFQLLDGQIVVDGKYSTMGRFFSTGQIDGFKFNVMGLELRKFAPEGRHHNAPIFKADSGENDYIIAMAENSWIDSQRFTGDYAAGEFIDKIIFGNIKRAEITDNHFLNSNIAIKLKATNNEKTTINVSGNRIDFALNNPTGRIDAIEIEIRDEATLYGDSAVIKIIDNVIAESTFFAVAGNSLSGIGDAISLRIYDTDNAIIEVSHNKIRDIWAISDTDSKEGIGMDIYINRAREVDFTASFNEVIGFLEDAPQLPEDGIQLDIKDTEKIKILISHNTFSNLDDDGIQLDISTDVGLNLEHYIEITDNTMQNINDDGIDVEIKNDTDVVLNLEHYIKITDNNMQNINDDGIKLEVVNDGATSNLDYDIEITDNTLQNINHNGIKLELINDAATSNLDYDIEITNNDLQNINDEGIQLEVMNDNEYEELSLKFSINNNRIDSGENGFLLI